MGDTFNPAGRKNNKQLKGHSAPVNSIAFSNSGAHIVLEMKKGLYTHGDVTTGSSLKKLKKHSASITSVSFSLDDTVIVSASKDHTVHLWDRDSGNHLRKLLGHASGVMSATFLPMELKLCLPLLIAQ